MDERILNLRARTRQLHATLGRLTEFWDRIEAHEPGPLRDGVSVLLGHALDRVTGPEDRSPVARSLDRDSASPVHVGVSALRRLGSVDAGFQLDCLEALLDLCEALLDCESDPFPDGSDAAWARDFRRLLAGEVDEPLEAVPEAVRVRWRKLREVAGGFEGARQITYEMAAVRALRGVVSWGIGHSRVPAGGESRGMLAVHVGESMLEELTQG